VICSEIVPALGKLGVMHVTVPVAMSMLAAGLDTLPLNTQTTLLTLADGDSVRPEIVTVLPPDSALVSLDTAPVAADIE